MTTVSKLQWLLFLGMALSSPVGVWAGPSSADYELEAYSFGSGGTNEATSADYQLFGLAGRVDRSSLSSADYKTLAGLTYALQATVPPAPTLANPSNYYNRLHLVLNQAASSPSDTTYAVAISSDNFVADTRYIQDDNTLGPTLGDEDWRAYAGVGGWGGAAGITLIGLHPNTTYTVKVTANRGAFTQAAFGPTAQASTIGPTLSFDLDVSATNQETTAPYQVSIGTLTPAAVVTSPTKIWVDLTTNAASGAMVYVVGSNNGLRSTTAGTTISAVSTNLASIATGYGARSSSVSQTAGGPMQAVAPYNGSGDTVGVLDTSKRIMYDSSSQPVTNGRVAFELKAKSTSTTPAGSDYGDSLTVLVTGAF